MSRIIRIHSYDWDWDNFKHIEIGPRFINSNVIVEVKRQKSGYTLVLYRSGKRIKGFFTKETPEDLMERINKEAK